uniref:DNA polymerase III subunit gamma/tau n=1 Tax=uncultured myxobacterium HF0130_06F04 TaxID=723555 RepID=E7C2F8_9BACT|nr:DNA polymerase III, gamma/tau subunits [uncultured myxobacterium HF0130_06F04]
MTYLALARKYRPRLFADIVGQEHVVQTLTNAISMDRVHHAFLFTGARGVGKTTTARILAAALNAEGGPATEPVLDDSICADIASGACPDVLEIDGASNTGVDNIRELRENVRYLPSRARFKLYIIDEVHMLSTAAFNALLKTLEEPPAHVKFIFATTEPHKIPVTILSRCQRFDFRKVPMALLVEHLRSILDKEGLSLGPEAVQAVAREAQGSVRDAMSLLDQVLSFTGGQPDDQQVIEALGIVDRQTIFELLDSVIARNADDLLALIARIDARGHELSDVCTLLVEHIRDVMVFKSAKEPQKVLGERSPGELSALEAQAGRCDSADLHRMFALAVEIAEQVTRSAFPKVSLEMGLLRLMEVEPAMKLEELLTRLDAVAGGAASSAHPSSSAPQPPAPARVAESKPEPKKIAQPAPAAAAKPVGPPKPQPAPPPEPSRAPLPPPPETMQMSLEPRTQPAPPPPEPPQSASSEPPRAEVDLGELQAELSIPDDAPVASEAWKGFVATTLQENPFVGSLLEHARVIDFSPESVKVGFVRSETFFWESASQKANTDGIINRVHQHFGKAVPVEILGLEDDVSDELVSLAQLKTHLEAARIAGVKRAGAAHPAVQMAVSVLGGDVQRVVALGTETDS